MEEAIGKPLSSIVKEDKDSVDEFLELLESHPLNAFQSWESQRSALARDPRYLSLSSDSARQDAFNQWKQKRSEAQTGSDECEKYVEFIQSKFKPGMLYAIFKRTFRNSPEFNCSLSEKEKEKLFQEYKMITQIQDPTEKANYIKANPIFSVLK